MALDPKILRKLNLYRQNPDIVQPLSNSELADLVLVVLDQTKVLEKALKDDQIDVTKELRARVNQLLKDYQAETDQLKKDLASKAQVTEAQLSETANGVRSELQQAVARLNERMTQLQDGKDGEVTDAEIQRAAQVAATLIQLPDVEQMVATAIQADGASVRNALELLTGDDRYKVEIADVTGLSTALDNLMAIRTQNGGTIGKQQVYGFIRQAVADGTILSTEITSPRHNQILQYDSTTEKWLNTLAITVSATQPSDPEAGDIWIDIS